MARTKRKVNILQPVTAAPDTPKQRIYRTGGYVRLSVEDSGRPGADTIDTQRELILGYISQQSDMELRPVLRQRTDGDKLRPAWICTDDGGCSYRKNRLHCGKRFIPLRTEL